MSTAGHGAGTAGKAGHRHGGGHGPEHGHAPVTLGGYLTGFVLAVILTAIPFWLVMSGVLGDKLVTALVIAGFAVAQVFVTGTTATATYANVA